MCLNYICLALGVILSVATVEKQTNYMTSMYIVYSLKSILLMFSRDLGQLFPQHPQIHYHTPPTICRNSGGLGFLLCWLGVSEVTRKTSVAAEGCPQRKALRAEDYFFEGTLLEDDHLEDGAVVPGQF